MKTAPNPKTRVKKTREADRHVDAVINALKILDLFEKSDRLRLKDIVKETSLNKSRVIRLCGSLIAMGYLLFSKADATYTLGTRLHLLGKAYSKNNPIYRIAKPILEQLAELSQETCSLFIIDNMQGFCLLRVEGPQPIRYSVSEGSRNELFQGASSKCLLAYADEASVKEVSRVMIEAKPDQDPDRLIKKLLAELDQIRRSAYAYSEGEVTPDLSALSCPVFDFNGKACAAMTTTVPTYRFSGEKRNELLHHLKKAALSCSRSLGWDGQDIDKLNEQPV